MNSGALVSRLFSIAPMMDWTDRHCRYFHRQLTKRSLLFTEMVTSAAIVHGNRERLLAFHPFEHPIAMQLGGSNPLELAEAARIAEGFGYDEINLNVGCPSDRVQSGAFGACLMRTPELVAACVSAMRQAVDLPVTVKCRLGVDDQDYEESLDRFADLVVDAGVHALYVHARKAWLQGLSPKENRNIPPLDHERVHRLAARLAPLPVIVNGGVADISDASRHLELLAGVMIGRAAYQNPRILLDVDGALFGYDAPATDLLKVIEAMADYMGQEMAKGVRPNQITRHMLGLANGLAGARRFRQMLSVESTREGAGPELLFQAYRELDFGTSTMPIAASSAELMARDPQPA